MRQSIRDIQPNGDVRSVFLLGASSLQQSRNGPYWRLELRDASGRLEAKIWSPLSSAFTELPAGTLAEVEGRAGLYREQVQLVVSSLRLLTAEEQAALPLADFMPASSRPGAEMLADLEALCLSELSHEPWRKFALSVLGAPDIRERLLSAPAAKNIHHAYAGGLLEHMLSVAGLCLRLADHYPDLDRQTLFVAAVFHDIGKLEEMSGGLATEYTDGGRLLGHIVQGLLMLEPHLAAAGVEPELALHFRHLLASHHGEAAFGSPRPPASAEAFALHHADNVDARISQLRGLFPPENRPAREEENGETETGMAWSPWQNLLERSLCRPARTPETPREDGREQEASSPDAPDREKKDSPSSPRRKDARQCSLL
jgi:3'-5' exoribonuclease